MSGKSIMLLFFTYNLIEIFFLRFYSKETSMLPLEDDPLAAEGLVHDRIRHLCKVYHYAKQWGPPIFPATVDEKNLTHNFGLSCKMNFSLNMIAVDSVENHHFAEALGIDIKNMKDMTAVVILDTKVSSGLKVLLLAEN